MANIIRIKRRDSGDDNAPSGLTQGEFAYNEHHQFLYLGGAAASQDVVAGAGAFARYPAGVGFIVQNALRSGAAVPTTINRVIAGTANEVVAADGNGVSGDPTLGIADNPILPGTGAVRVVKGTTGEEPVGVAGDIRYDTTTNKLRLKDNVAWADLAVAGGDPDQNLFETIAGDTGTAVADTTTDTLTIAGGTGIVTVGASTPDTLTIDMDIASMTSLGAAPASADSLAMHDDGVGPKRLLISDLFISPALTSTPTAPTASAATSNTQIATTAFVRLVRLDEMATPTGDVAFGSQKLTGVADGTAATDGVNLGQLNSVASGVDWKGSCDAATTQDLGSEGTGHAYNATAGASGRGQHTWSAGPTTLDGVTLANADRMLVKDNSPGSENGIFVRTGANTWDRAEDFDEDDEVTGGAATWINEGTTQSDTGWILTTDDPIIIGGGSGTVLVFTQFSGLGQITAGAGLTKTGNTIDAVGTTNRITVNANDIDIAATYVGQTSITTLGTITAGTWSATAIGPTKGGTGLTTYTTGDVLYASGANVLAKLAIGSTDDLLKISGGVPTWSNVVDGGTF